MKYLDGSTFFTRASALLIVSAASHVVHAAELLGTANVPNPKGTRISLSSGATTEVGDFTLNGSPLSGTFSDLASATLGGPVYGLGVQAGQANLFTVEPGNGSLLFNGSITLNGSPLVTNDAVAIAVDGAGTLRMVANVAGASGYFTINTTTGAATFLGGFTLNGNPINFADVIGLATSPTGETYGLFETAGTRSIFRLQASSGELALVGTPTLGGFQLGGVFSDLAFGPDGTMYTTNLTGGVTSLLCVSTTDGSLMLLSSINGAEASPFTGLAYIPSPGSAALAVLGALLVVSPRRR